ncbi:TldD/PmbA family protein [Chromatium okenii]|jgi:predicted Zn-dependent protease|uniref:Peptidase n=1 Tax=Chromatium okenii TaxID=61644 RepID=A0A2S7XSC5_9GAMM|nr:metallopeptidase TldD-related protein [Chromatium okenii]PQJ96453.1 peptidase [Chromatium okenii]
MNQDAFFTLTERLHSGLTGSEVLFSNLSGEVSDFVRLNRNRIRQAGHVQSAGLELTLIDGARQVEGRCELSGEFRADLSQTRHLLTRLRERLADMPDDPYLQYSTTPSSSDRRVGEASPPAAQVMADLIRAADGLDLVGIWASGDLSTGLASSLGHRHWHHSQSFNLDWSCYLETDKAVKASLGGLHWDAAALHHRLETQRHGLRVMARPARTIEPGRYRAYLAPAAVNELMHMLSWGGFDLRNHRTHQTPLLRLVRGERQFSPQITLREEHERGLTAGFTAEGFVKPAVVTLIDGGKFGQCLVDARSGQEYGEAVNAAGDAPEALALAAGEMPLTEVLARLDTGLFIGNLWYCNWSDPNDCRVTGMTRFGTYWVEHGEIVCPVKVMRFDDSLYHLLGDGLEALTSERELMLSAETYEGRATDSALLPGLLVSGITLAL